MALYAALGMKPVVIRREIEAFVGDRLLEALWREALWLVKDDVASVEEIDDIIRYSFGLRWAQMGLFQTYRIAGGEAGMRHFLAQFGPALKWPWTKLMDVPDLDDALVDKIAGQSDAQAGGALDPRARAHPRRQPRRHRPRPRRAAGRQGLGRRRAAARRTRRVSPRGGRGGRRRSRLRLAEGRVPEAWIDYNGHMTESRYLQVFGETTDALLARIGADAAYVAGGPATTPSKPTSAISARRSSARRGTRRRRSSPATTSASGCSTACTPATARLLATGEQMLLHVDMKAGRACRAAAEVLARLGPLAAAHRPLAWPGAAGRAVGDG